MKIKNLNAWWAWLAFALIWFVPLGYRGLIHSDEGRYALLGLEMFRSGDWITPRLNGLLYFEKPVFQYWMTALSFTVFGVNDFAARMWPALSGFLSVVVVYFTAQRLWTERAAVFAAAVTGSSVWIIGNAHFLTVDMGLTFFLTLTACGFLLAQRDEAAPAEQRWGMWLAWAAMAGATLSKGLIGILIPGATLFLYSLWCWHWQPWRKMQWVSGLVIFFALAAPWFVLVSQRNPDFAHFFFIHEHFERFLTTQHKRVGAWWYFFPILFVGFLPWTTYLPVLLQAAVKRTTAQFQTQRFMLVWLVFTFVFFSRSGSKLPSYILPMFPVLGLMLGRYLDQAATAAQIRRHLWLPSLIWLAALLASPFYTYLEKPDTPPEMIFPLALSVGIGATLFLLCAGVAWQQLKQERLTQGILAIALGSLLSISIGTLGHDAYGKLKSSRDLVKVIAPYLTPDTEVFSVRTYEQSFPYYLNRNVVLVDFVDEFDFGQKQEPQKWMPKIEQFIARWNEIPHAAAMMGQDTYDTLQVQGLPMQVVYHDARRIVVVKPATK